MPNRIIRDGWLESEAINSLDPREENFFLRLCLRADDFGRYHANPVLLKSNLYPLREDVRSTDIPRYLAACEKAGLVRCYQAEAKAFIEIVKFCQRIKEGAKSKFPAPPVFSGLFPESPGSSGSFRPCSEAESESETSSKGESCAAAASPGRRRDALLDSLAALSSGDLAQVTRSQWGAVAKALSEIRAVCPAVTPEEIGRRAENYRRRMPSATITASALAKHWAMCDSAASGSLPSATALTDADVERINRTRVLGGEKTSAPSSDRLPTAFGSLGELQAWAKAQPVVYQQELFAFGGRKYFVVVRDEPSLASIRPQILVFETLDGWKTWQLAVVRNWLEGKLHAEVRGSDIVFIHDKTKKTVLIVPMDMPRGPASAP